MTEEALATQADALTGKVREFAASLIHRQPSRDGAREIYRLAAQLFETADAVDKHRGY
ncbi:hypothetical protein [Streptomyces sp. NPDC006551]|uniref:hypothetical protein n=1 Tax=Streptomyces sp. NPDC006551 TaxID=3157178 RepID=UPI0033B49E0E